MRLPTGLLCAWLALSATACSEDPSPPFEVKGTGAIEGLVYFDADRNGLFDPAAGDSALAGVRLLVRERGTRETLANGTGTSNAQGRFLISNLVPGTHDLAVDTASIPTGMRFCQNPVQVSVFIGERQFASMAGRPACIITIADAEQTRGVPVMIQGIVTSSPGQLRGQYTYLQDETGGLRIFSPVPEGKGIAIGDRIEVTGTISEFNADIQLGGTVVLGAIQKNAFLITPEVLTTGELAQAGKDPAAPELGILARIRKARVETVFGANNADYRNTWVNDGSGLAQLRFESGVFPQGASNDATKAALTAQFAVGKCYDITGVTGAFRGDGQIFPRTLADIQEVSCQ